MDQWMQLLNKSLAAIEQGVIKYGPQAVDMLLWVRRLDAIQALVVALLQMSITSVVLVLGVRWFNRTLKSLSEEYNDDWSHHPEIVLPACFTGAAAVVVFIAGLMQFFNIWNWVGVFAPHLALAHDLIEKVTK